MRAWLRDRTVLALAVESAGHSQRQLAKLAGLGHATLNHLVTGRRDSCSPDTARRLETVLDQPAGTLFDRRS